MRIAVRTTKSCESTVTVVGGQKPAVHGLEPARGTQVVPLSRRQSDMANAAKTVLVVDDDVSFAYLTASILDCAEYRAVIATDGTEGVRMAREIIPYPLIQSRAAGPYRRILRYALRATQEGRVGFVWAPSFA